MKDVTGIWPEAPGICFICEGHLDRNTPYVDTGRDFAPEDMLGNEIRTTLTGRKYLCVGCLRGAIEALDPERKPETTKRGAAGV